MSRVRCCSRRILVAGNRSDKGHLYHVLFGALVIVVVGSLLGEWAGAFQWLAEIVVLVRPSGLGIPGARTSVAAGARRSLVVLVLAVAAQRCRLRTKPRSYAR